MKFPALALAASLASGIVAGSLIATSHSQAAILFVILSAALIVSGLVLIILRRTTPAWVVALLAWAALGAAAGPLERLAIPANHITRLIARSALDLEQPLRWQGTLRLDPLGLPWGVRYQVELESVQAAGERTPVIGGLRTDYYFDEGASQQPPALRAGDRVEILARARTVRNFANPGSFDYRAFLARQDIHLISTLRSAALIEKIPGPPPAVAHRMARGRGRLLNETDTMLAGSEGHAAVVRAMLLGDRSFLDTEQVEAFRETGVYHILVLSGLQVGVLAAVLLWTGRRLRLPPLARIGLTLSALWAYAGIVEDQPPILRAVWMATVYLLAYTLFRRTHVLNAIGLAALVILGARPSEIGNASFLLSFLAVATIGGIAAPWLERTAGIYLRTLDHLGDVSRDASHPPRAAQFRLDLRTATAWLAGHLPQPASRFAAGTITAHCRAGLWLWETIVISAAIQVAMLPLMAQYFHRITVLGLAANVPAVLLTGFIVPFGFLSLGASVAWQPLGQLFGHILAPAVGAMVWSVEAVSRLSSASYRVPSPPLPVVVGFLAGVVALSAAILTAKRRTTWAAGVFVLAMALLIATHPFAPRLHRGQLEVTVLDVGQGDSIFVAFPGGRTMLVDAGGLPGSSYIRSRRPGIDVGEDVVSPFLWARGLRRLDVVALTHAHQDHLGGLAAVLRNFQVGEFWVGREVRTAAYETILAEARRRGVPVVQRRRGDTFDWDGVRLRVVWPASGAPTDSARNDDSLVLRLETGRESLLLAGDIEVSVERALTADSNLLAAGFLKIPHHGGRSSTTEAFLDSVSPRFVAISVGETNPFGHPSPDVLKRIEHEGARLYRTDRHGAITALTEGKQIEIHTYLAAP